MVPSILVPDPISPDPTSPDPISEPGSPNWGHAALVALAGYAVLVVTLLGIGFALTHLDSSVGRWDESVNRWFASHRTGTWNSITGTSTWFVNTVPAIGVAAIITAVLAVLRRWREAAMLVIALALELAVFLSVTFVVARPRPDVPRLNSTPSTSSFPSGHTAAATVLFAGLAIIVTCCTRNTVVRITMFVIAVAVAALIGFARVYRGMHHPTDVIVGALLGAACLIVAVLTVRASARRPESEVRTSDRTAARTVRSDAA
jgi:undecaprenyl-diphosphatase